MTEELTILDPADHLKSDQAIADFMCAALETNDSGYVAHALGVVARAKGMTEIARRTRLSREQLAVLQAVGIQLRATKAETVEG